MVTRTDYGAALIFSIGVLVAPAILVFAAYQSGVHEFFDPDTLSTVTAYAPYGGQVVGMVASIAFFVFCYMFVLWGVNTSNTATLHKPGYEKCVYRVTRHTPNHYCPYHMV